MNQLTSKQLEIANMIAAGKRPGQIARELGVRGPTVSVHLREIMKKLGVTDKEMIKDALQGRFVSEGHVPKPAPEQPAVSALVPLQAGDRVRHFLLDYCFAEHEIDSFYTALVNVAATSMLFPVPVSDA